MNWRTSKWLWTVLYKQLIKSEAYIYQGGVQVFDSFTAVGQGWNERVLLITRIDELNLASYLKEDLIVFDTIEEVNKEWIHTSEDYKLFKKNTQSFDIKEKKKRYKKFKSFSLKAFWINTQRSIRLLENNCIYYPNHFIEK